MNHVCVAVGETVADPHIPLHEVWLPPGRQRQRVVPEVPGVEALSPAASRRSGSGVICREQSLPSRERVQTEPNDRGSLQSPTFGDDGDRNDTRRRRSEVESAEEGDLTSVVVWFRSFLTAKVSPGLI